MTEQHDLDAPIPASGGTAFWKVTLLTLSRDLADPANSFIKVALVGEFQNLTVMYDGTTADDDIKFLNTVDLSANSLQKRVLERLEALGLIGAGDISGVPDA